MLAGALALAWSAIMCWGLPSEEAKGPVLTSLPAEQSLKKARVDGKYCMLLRQIRVAEDGAQFGDFRDVGPRDVKAIAGHADLPKGHWVYVYPYWYIWRDLVATPKPKRAWGPEQATGPPDTPQAGDIQTAWASLTPDGQDEWLLLEYSEPVVPKAVLVYETYNPGALYRVTVFKLNGEEVEVWKGKDPTPMNSGMGISEITFRVSFKTNRVKIYLDSKNVPGWNEIDAVGLRDTADKTHWAVSADASSTYAEQGGVGVIGPVGVRVQVVPAMPAPVPVIPMPAPRLLPRVPPAVIPVNPIAPPQPPPAAPDKHERIKQLEEEVRQLKETIKELREQLKKK
jgi:hypothetical protein